MTKDSKSATPVAKEATSKVEKLGKAVEAPATTASGKIAKEAPAVVKAAQDAAQAKKDAAAVAAKAKEEAKAAQEAAKAERAALATPIPAPKDGSLVEGQKYIQTMQSPMVVFGKKTISEGDKSSRMGGKGVQVEVQVLPGTNVASVKKPGSTRIFYTILENLDTTPAPEAAPVATETAEATA
jgi:hypothetical protein